MVPPLGMDGWSAEQMAISPDGAHLAFVGTVAGDPFSKPRLVLTGDPPRDISPPGTVVRSFGWMPDSKAILVGYGHELAGDPDAYAIVGLDGSVVRTLPSDQPLESYGRIAVSANAATALLTLAPIEQGRTAEMQLWMMTLTDGSLVPVNLSGPGSNPHGPSYIDQVTIAVSGDGDRSELPTPWVGVGDLANGTSRTLTSGLQVASDPTVVPGGEWIVYDAFSADTRDDRRLWTVPVDGSSEPRELIDETGRSPAVTADGRHVLLIVTGKFPGRASVIKAFAVPEDAPWLDG